MILNYLKTFFLSLKRQKGFVLLNQIVLAGSMIVIMVLVAIMNILLEKDSMNFKEGNLYSLRVQERDYLNPMLKPEKLKQVKQCFPEDQLCFFSVNHSGSVVFKHRNRDINYRYINKNASEVLNFKFIYGDNFFNKHFDQKQKVILVSENLAINYWGDADVIGKTFVLKQNSYKVVGVYKSFVTGSSLIADVYVPWSVHEYPDHLSPAVLLKVNEETSQQNIQSKLDKHAKNENIVALSRADIRQTEELFPLLIMMGLSILLPALLLTNLTTHRMESKLQELGLRKAFGAPRKTIYGHLLIENIVFTLLAGCIAFLIGQYLVSSLYYGFSGSFWRFEVPPNVFLWVLGFFVLYGTVTGIIPAYRVARQTIIQSLNVK